MCNQHRDWREQRVEAAAREMSPAAFNRASDVYRGRVIASAEVALGAADQAVGGVVPLERAVDVAARAFYQPDRDAIRAELMEEEGAGHYHEYPPADDAGVGQEIWVGAECIPVAPVAEVEKWREEAWACYVASGADPDGADARHLNLGEAPRAVRELLSDYEEALAELYGDSTLAHEDK